MEQKPPGQSANPYDVTRFVRGEGPGFDRAVFFTDAVYAIAMTLIVVGLDVPRLRGADESSASALFDALGAMSTELLTFFVTFVVIGQYWIANHRFTSSLRAVDSRLILINLGYLSIIAFLPFPSSLLGDYSENPAAVALFAGCLAIVSALEFVQLYHARAADLLLVAPDEDGFRWMRTASLNPVFWFTISIVVAFSLGALAGMLTWILAIPTSMMLDRRRPPSMRAT